MVLPCWLSILPFSFGCHSWLQDDTRMKGLGDFYCAAISQRYHSAYDNALFKYCSAISISICWYNDTLFKHCSTVRLAECCTLQHTLSVDQLYDRCHTASIGICDNTVKTAQCMKTEFWEFPSISLKYPYYCENSLISGSLDFDPCFYF